MWQAGMMEPFYRSPRCRLYLGDARGVLKQFNGASIDCVVTSPPYYKVRRYNGAGSEEIGHERTPEDYVVRLAEVGRELLRVVAPHGSFWLNVGDVCREKEWLGIPWRVAFVMRDLGWKIRNEVIWHKPKHVPNASPDRLTPAHEQVFHFVKSKKPYYDMDAVRQPPAPPIMRHDGSVMTPTGVSGARYRQQILQSKALTEAEKRAALAALAVALDKVRDGRLPDFRMLIRGTQRPTHGDASDLSGRAKELETRGYAILTYHRRGSTPTDVWSIQVEDAVFHERHFAIFPEALVERPVKATCPPDGTVLDPFIGSGTTAVVAMRLGRKAIGIDISSDYLEFAKERVLQIAGQAAPLEMFTEPVSSEE